MKYLISLFVIFACFSACKKDKVNPANNNSGNNNKDTTKPGTSDTAGIVRNTSSLTYRVDVYQSITDYNFQQNAIDSFNLEPGKSRTFFKSNLGSQRLYLDCYTADFKHSNWELDSARKTINNGKNQLILLNFEESDARNALLKGRTTYSSWKSIDAYKLHNGQPISIWDTMRSYVFNLSFNKRYTGSFQILDSPRATTGGNLSLAFAVCEAGDSKFNVAFGTISPSSPSYYSGYIPPLTDTVYSHWSTTAWNNTAATADTMMMTKFGISYILIRE
jgi:hypothetical protein